MNNTMNLQQLKDAYENLHSIIYPNSMYNDEAWNSAKDDGRLLRMNTIQQQISDYNKQTKANNLVNAFEALSGDVLTKSAFINIAKTCKGVTKATSYNIIRQHDNHNVYFYFESGYKYIETETRIHALTDISIVSYTKA